MRTRVMYAILCKAEKQNALTLDTLSNAAELNLVQDFDTQHPRCLHIWRSGADLILAHSRGIYETKCNFFPTSCLQIIQGSEIDHWGWAFLIAQDNKLTEE